jgi:hypothetical protein
MTIAVVINMFRLPDILTGENTKCGPLSDNQHDNRYVIIFIEKS